MNFLYDVSRKSFKYHLMEGWYPPLQSFRSLVPATFEAFIAFDLCEFSWHFKLYFGIDVDDADDANDYNHSGYEKAQELGTN